MTIVYRQLLIMSTEHNIGIDIIMMDYRSTGSAYNYYSDLIH